MPVGVVDFLPTAPTFHYQGGSVGISRAIMAIHKQTSLRRYLRKFSRSTPIVLSLQMSILLDFRTGRVADVSDWPKNGIGN